MAKVQDAGGRAHRGISSSGRGRGLLTQDALSESAVAPPVAGNIVASWHAPGGPSLFGHLLPAVIAALGLAALGGAAYLPLHGGGVVDIAPTVFLGLLAIVVTWLFWKVLRTVWQIDRATDNTIVCWSTRRQWLLSSDEILAVKGDAYGVLLALFTVQGVIRVWAQMGDRSGLLAAIRRSSPRVQIDRYAEPGRR